MTHARTRRSAHPQLLACRLLAAEIDSGLSLKCIDALSAKLSAWPKTTFAFSIGVHYNVFLIS